MYQFLATVRQVGRYTVPAVVANHYALIGNGGRQKTARRSQGRATYMGDTASPLLYPYLTGAAHIDLKNLSGTRGTAAVQNKGRLFVTPAGSKSSHRFEQSFEKRRTKTFQEGPPTLKTPR